MIVVIASAAAETAAEIKNRNHTDRIRIRGSDHNNDCTNAMAIPPALQSGWQT
jgi:hypothetical protein